MDFDDGNCEDASVDMVLDLDGPLSVSQLELVRVAEEAAFVDCLRESAEPGKG